MCVAKEIIKIIYFKCQINLKIIFKNKIIHAVINIEILYLTLHIILYKIFLTFINYYYIILLIYIYSIIDYFFL